MNRLFLFLVFSLLSQIFSWEIALPGRVIATPVEVTKYRVVLICEDRRIYSIDSRSGEIKWKVRPGSKLIDISESPDGTITVLSSDSLLSYYDDGVKRWEADLQGGELLSMSIDRSGNTFVSSSSGIFKVDRYGRVQEFNQGKSSIVLALNNSLILSTEGNTVSTFTRDIKNIWNLELPGEVALAFEMDDSIYLSLKSGKIFRVSLNGEVIREYEQEASNPEDIFRNYRGEIVVKSGGNLHILDSGKSLTIDDSVENILFYSNGYRITSFKDWRLSGEENRISSQFYPSGWIQRIDSSSRGSDIRIWGDESTREHYRSIVKGGKRESQKKEFKKIEMLLKGKEILGSYPNFYYFLLIASSYENPLEDCRREAYRIIGLSRDLIFKPFLSGDLVNEESYLTLPYIIFALGQIGGDSTGEVMGGIVDRIDDYYDEKVAVNSLYALYNINEYYNRKYTNILYTGVERILTGGYSRKVENRCYEILERIK